LPKSIEDIKADGLDVDLEALARGGFGSVRDEDFYRLKTRGVCSPRKSEQDFMIRIRVPSGALAADQAERIAELARAHARGWAHLSTRQNVELHMVQAEDAPRILARLGEVGLSTRSACGDTIRNLAVCPCAGLCATEVVDVRPWARLFHDYFIECADYYDRRLPRKVNVYFADCEACADEVRLNDVALVGACDPLTGEAGFAVWAGGGQGGQQPRLAGLLCPWLPLSDGLAATRAVLEVLIEHGERNMRARAKLKFLIEKHGWPWFADAFEPALDAELARVGRRMPSAADAKTVPSPSPYPFGCHTPPGSRPHPSSPGHFAVAVRVVLGELTADQLEGLARLARERADGHLWLTKRQNLELRFVPGQQLAATVGGVRDLGLRLGKTDGLLDVMACVGMEYCPIGVTSTQVVAADLIVELESASFASDIDALRVNLSACPNSCGQHHVGDVGFSGMRLPDKHGGGPGYQVFVGGATGSSARLGAAIARVRETDAVRTAKAAAEVFQAERRDDEAFASVVARLGADGVRQRLSALLGADVLIPIHEGAR